MRATRLTCLSFLGFLFFFLVFKFSWRNEGEAVGKKKEKKARENKKADDEMR